MNPRLDQPCSRGVLLIGHGTRDEVGTSEFFQLGELLAKRVHPTPVQPALLEFQRPSIPEAWDRLVARGTQHVDVAPLLLFAAGHAKQDIPNLIVECQSRTPQVSSGQSIPISRHPSIIDLVQSRLTESIEQLGTDAGRLAVIMVGRGSHDPCAQADMRVMSEIIGRRVAAAATVTAFYAMANPPLIDVLESVASSGRFDAIAVHPHLLFQGRLHQAICRLTEEAAQRHPSLRFTVSPYLGIDPRVVEAITERIDQIETP